jgi:hypothetical protein
LGGEVGSSTQGTGISGFGDNGREPVQLSRETIYELVAEMANTEAGIRQWELEAEFRGVVGTLGGGREF